MELTQFLPNKTILVAALLPYLEGKATFLLTINGINTIALSVVLQ